MAGDYQALVCGKSQLYRGQGLAAAVGFLPISRMFLKNVSDFLCSNPAGPTEFHMGTWYRRKWELRKVDKQTDTCF